MKTKTIRFGIRPSHVSGYTEVIKIVNNKIEVMGNRRTVVEAKQYAQELREHYGLHRIR